MDTMSAWRDVILSKVSEAIKKHDEEIFTSVHNDILFELFYPFFSSFPTWHRAYPSTHTSIPIVSFSPSSPRAMNLPWLADYYYYYCYHIKMKELSSSV